MPRISRAVIPGVPHHVTQRGNRRQRTFFARGDFERYVALLSEWCRRAAVEVWAYCLMPNHVHIVAVPRSPSSLRTAFGEAHRRYSRQINLREGWRGYLWQGRFASCAMDERHLRAAARYVELNPVRAGLVERPEDYAWSSARGHLAGRDDELVRVEPMLRRFPDWRSFLGAAADPDEIAALRLHATSGRPLGDEAFVASAEASAGRSLTPRRSGRPAKSG